MKPATETKLKFKQLKRRLKLPHWQAVGVLESLWRVTEANCPEGDIGRITNEEIASAIEWEGDADDLIAALVECRWLDEDSDFRLIVHDWSMHCPNHLKGALAKHNRQFADLNAKHRADASQQTSRQNQEQAARERANGSVPPLLSSPFLSSTSTATATSTAPADAEAAVAELVSLGGEAKASRSAVDSAMRVGCTVQYLFDVMDFWKANPGSWGVGALVNRIAHSTPKCPPSMGWPEPLKPKANGPPKPSPAAQESSRIGQATNLIKTMQAAGNSDDQIKAALAKRGWDWP